MRAIRGLFGILALVGCGSGVHKRILTRPDSYHKLVAFPSTGSPVDIKSLEREYPELKGIVITAPEWLDQFERLSNARAAMGLGLLEYRISPGASLSIEVEDEYSLTLTVPPTGEWYFRDIGRVRLAGLTLDELRTQLEDRLGKILRKPSVVLNLLTGSPRTFWREGGPQSVDGSGLGSIIVIGAAGGGGATAFPQGIPYVGNQTLVSVLGAGLSGNAEWRQVRVIRRDPVDPLRKSRIIICDLWNYIAQGDVRQDIPLLPGDVVYVPEKWTAGDQWGKDMSIFQRVISDAFFFKNLPDTIAEFLK